MSQVDRYCLFLHLLVWPQWLLLHNNTQESRGPLAELNLLSKMTKLVILIVHSQKNIIYKLARDWHPLKWNNKNISETSWN